MKTKNVRVTAKPTAKPAQPATGPILDAQLIAALKSAASVEAAVGIMSPPPVTRPKVDAVYTVATACTAPLPGKRGACLKVVAVAVRLNAPFRVSDITAALPDVKSSAYWTRKLFKSGHLVEAA
jgi:hypothetical protein